MSDDIKRLAGELIKNLEGCSDSNYAAVIRDWPVVLQLKAALRPSREECADVLESFNKNFVASDIKQLSEMIRCTIQYLRGES